MSNQQNRRAFAASGAAAVLLLASGCGSADPVKPTPTGTATPTAGATTAPIAIEGSWLLRFNTEGSGESETTRAVYVRYTPSTGAANAVRLPGASAPDTSSEDQALMVSADQRFALLDAAVTRADSKRGRLTLYPLQGGAKRVVDLRRLTGDARLRPVAAAFDPAEAEVLRVVDSGRRVWKVDPIAHTAVRDGSLPTRGGWIFANGFDKNTGLPYIEDIDSNATLPAGNGADDVRPVKRRGGVIRAEDASVGSGEPSPPCGFSGGFTTADGTAWLFCADTPKLAAYRLLPGAEDWVPVGTPSAAIVPGSAVELPVVLPPLG